jgi:hypothetical protein
MLKDIFISNRPNLKKSSVDSYATTINVISKSIGKTICNPKDALDFKVDILHSFTDLEPQVRRHRMAALVVFFDKFDDCGWVPEMRIQMQKDKDAYTKIQNTQKKSQKQTDNWLDWNTILEKVNILEKEIEPLFIPNTPMPNKNTFIKVQTYIILSCFTLITPRRSIDFTEFKLRNYDESVNFMIGNQFVFNTGKTIKWTGPETVPIPDKLRDIILKWKTITKSDWLLSDFNSGNKITSGKITHYLNNFFNLNLSIQKLRPIFASCNTTPDDVETFNRIKQDAKEMGHSTETHLNSYIKRD